MQYLPNTFKAHSIQVLGYHAEMTRTTVEYVATVTLQKMFDKGYDEETIARIWNQGNPSKCKSGTNSLGVKFNSCSYVKKVLSNLNK